MQNCSDRDFAIILAAGYSTRMGTCKTALPWRNNQTLLRYQAEQFLQAGITPIIVLGSHNAHRRSDCPKGSQVVINLDCDRGKTSSILAGLDCLPLEFSTITISAVDQPRSLYIYQTLLQTFYQEKALITAPFYQGKLGHPLLFSEQLFPELKKISESSLGLRKIVKEFYDHIKKIAFDHPEVLSDLNHKVTYNNGLDKIKRQ
ncbi:nucleotidyltransferase family protein [Pleurocapsa sp. FMAR1]|uniref:nucleotidyltransferase family protein n=1 Tax=Pleurocapsa sp. FMAR1 TaxID=3040204 RepID=UPI0029C69A2E|nr:nucleotidyltransferase family protein [Pleurocapsa sp. FMAR1]